MATYPIKVLLDRNRQPFIPFSTTSSIVENGTNRRLDKILGNLDDLQTNNKNSLVSAINEILTQHGSGGSSTGWQVVDVLPTENISATTIYLLPKEGAKKPNIYEEWIWVNNDWENIGTTEIDLSGYATTGMVGDLNNLLTTDKDNLVDAINEIVGTAGGTSANIGNLNNLNTEDKSSIVNAINEVASTGTNHLILINYTNGNKEIAQKAIDAMKKGKQVIIIKKPNSNSGNNSNYGPMYVCSPTLSVGEDYTGTVYFKSNYFMSVGYNSYNSTKELEYLPYFYQLTISVTNGVVTSAGDISSTSNYNSYRPIPVLSKENKSAYTPTADYHPATKKYVDDTVAAAGAGGGSAFDPAKYLAIDNTTEYTPTDLYHPATKKFVESVVASIDTSGFITNSNISEHLANYITETTLNERLMKVPYIMTPNVSITSDFNSSDYWGDNILICNINNTDWSVAIQKIAQAILSKNWPKVYLPISVFPNVDDFNRTQTNKMFRRHFLMELKPSNFGYFADEISHTYTAGDEISTYFDGSIDLGIYGTLNVSFGITYQYDGTSWTYSSYSNPYAYLYIGRVTPVSSLNLTFDNKQIVHSYTEGYKHSRVFSSQVTGCKNLPVNATTKIADLAGTSTLPDGLSTKCELFGTTVSGDTTTYTPLGEATVFVYNNEMYMKVPNITTTDYTDVVCTISMTYED